MVVAFSSVLSALPQADCCLPAAAVAASDAEGHAGHGSHEHADAGTSDDRHCSHDEHGISCQQHCVTQAIIASAAPDARDRASVVAIVRPFERPSAVSLPADPPPPRA